MKTYTGTSHFVSLEAARRYYKDYVPNYTDVQLATWVEMMFANGSFRIGKPAIKEGQRLSINDEGRYIIMQHN